MKGKKKVQLEEELAHKAAEFLNERANTVTSLITVTRAAIAESGKQATIYISVIPEEKKEESLVFVERSAKPMREYIEHHTRMGMVPYLAIAIDDGEKNRQRIEELS